LYNIDAVLGFAEELIVEDDPEYHWTDQFRASRISNAERSYLLYRLSGYILRRDDMGVRTDLLQAVSADKSARRSEM
jgi:hypothetical protein